MSSRPAHRLPYELPRWVTAERVAIVSTVLASMAFLGEYVVISARWSEGLSRAGLILFGSAVFAYCTLRQRPLGPVLGLIAATACGALGEPSFWLGGAMVGVAAGVFALLPLWGLRTELANGEAHDTTPRALIRLGSWMLVLALLSALVAKASYVTAHRWLVFPSGLLRIPQGLSALAGVVAIALGVRQRRAQPAFVARVRAGGEPCYRVVAKGAAASFGAAVAESLPSLVAIDVGPDGAREVLLHRDLPVATSPYRDGDMPWTAIAFVLLGPKKTVSLLARKIDFALVLALFGGCTSTCGLLCVPLLGRWGKGNGVAEGRYALSQVAKNAAMAYEQKGRLCASASNTVPRSIEEVRGKTYQSRPEEWGGDENTGWKCLKFELDRPQYHMYKYTVSAAGDAFTVESFGDLYGDRVTSHLRVTGKVEKGQIQVAPRIEALVPEQ